MTATHTSPHASALNHRALDAPSPGIVNTAGYAAGLAAFGATVAYVLVQLLQLAGVLRPPLDGILVYATSLCIVVPFVLEVLALHHLTSGDRRLWSSAAVLFSTMYAVFVSANYVVQLATVIPVTTDPASVRVLDQTPHSMYWDYDAIGYVAMGFATFFAALAVPAVGYGRWARRALLANALVTPLISTVYFYPRFSIRLFVLAFPWGIAAPLCMLFLAIALRRRQPA